ncbi:MAG: hypothetical protein IT437_02620 [Phycisphaerales bacterium]|nr:hypothetical protein [Phycisphaerales bacterium]
MKFDWEEIRYQWNDLRYRPEVKRRLLTAGAAAIILLVLIAFFFSILGGRSGPPARVTAAPVNPRGTSPPAPSYRGAKEFAADLQGDLSADPRFAGIAVVPTVMGSGGEVGRIVLMGELPPTDLADLRTLVARKQPPVKIDWNVTQPRKPGG